MDFIISINLWLIRLYALIIVFIVFSNTLEGAAFNLVILMAVALIILQSFFISSKRKSSTQK